MSIPSRTICGKRGILTDEIRDRAIQLIDSDFGLEIWAESGEKILNQRKKALADFRAMLLSPMGPKKKIKPDVYTDTIFNEGDIVAIQLKTANKSIAKHAREYTDMTDEEFHSYDGKYVLLAKISDKSSWQCAMVPEIHDWWANFRSLNGIYEEIPDSVDTDRLTDAPLSVVGSRCSPVRAKHVLLQEKALQGDRQSTPANGEIPVFAEK